MNYIYYNKNLKFIAKSSIAQGTNNDLCHSVLDMLPTLALFSLILVE